MDKITGPFYVPSKLYQEWCSKLDRQPMAFILTGPGIRVPQFSYVLLPAKALLKSFYCIYVN